MSSGADPVEFVLSSSVRSAVLRSIGDGTQTTDGLLEDVDASSSAIYEALGRLEEAGLLRSAGEDWTLTGSGRVIADCVDERERLDLLLDDAGSYLASHDTCALPERFRLRLGELAGGWVLTASSTEPQDVVREVSDRLDRADTALIATPIYDELFETVLPDPTGCRVVVDHGVVESAANELGDDAEIEAELEEYAVYDIRVTDANFSMAVTETALMLSLPLIDGGYDTQTEFLAEHDRARQWGRDLFERLWAEGEELEPYVLDHYL